MLVTRSMDELGNQTNSYQDMDVITSDHALIRPLIIWALVQLN